MEFNRRQFLALGAATFAGCAAPTADSADSDPTSDSSSPDTSASRATSTPTGTAVQDPPTPDVAWDNLVGGQYAINTPAIVGDLVVFQSDSEIFALTRNSGALAWSTDLKSYPNYYFPVSRNGVVYATGQGSDKDGRTGTITAVDSTNGDIIWRKHNNIATSPAVGISAVYFSEAPSQEPSIVKAVTPDTGEERWRFEITDGTNNDVRFGPTLDGDQLIAGATYQPKSGGLAGVLYCLDTTTGEQLWRTTIDTTIGTKPVIGADGVCVGTSNGGVLHLFEASSGEERWTFERLTGSSNFWARPAAADGTIFAGNIGGVLALDGQSGDKRWEVKNNRLSSNGVVVRDGSVYTAGRSVFALAAADGTVEWSFEKLQKASAAFSPPAIADGRAYVGSCLKDESTDVYDHVVYGLELPDTGF